MARGWSMSVQKSTFRCFPSKVATSNLFVSLSVQYILSVYQSIDKPSGTNTPFTISV